MNKLRAALVGCRGMGAWHARSLVRCREVALVGLCDLEGSVAEGLAAELLESAPELRVFTDMGAMLADLEPDLVTIATPNITHAALTLQAARYGVQAICCEKPMAVNLAEAREMHRVCRDAGTVLIVNHQRRTLPAMVRMREMIEEGAIGEVQLLRGTCQGDLLTDGTHVVDSLLHLSGDAEVDWVFGSVYRNPPPAGETPSGGFRAAGGYRYGHPIETGAAGIWQFAAGPRAEVFTGGLHLPGRQYNDYEVLGTTGRLWRSGDREHPGVYLQSGGSGDWQPVRPRSSSEFGAPEAVITDNYDSLAALIRSGGGDHPLSSDRALRGFEILMAIFESARTRARIELPLRQDQFPLALMLEAGQP